MSLHDVLTSALKELYIARPAPMHAVEWLANYLREHNPSSPHVISTGNTRDAEEGNL